MRAALGAGRDVVGRAAGLELVDEPEALLGEGEGERAVAGDRPEGRQGRGRLANPDAAFLAYRDGAVFALHMRCCDIHLKLEPNDHAVEEAIALANAGDYGLAASVWTWAIIFTHATRLRRLNRSNDAYEKDFWASTDIEAFAAKRTPEFRGD